MHRPAVLTLLLTIKSNAPQQIQRPLQLIIDRGCLAVGLLLVPLRLGLPVESAAQVRFAPAGRHVDFLNSSGLHFDVWRNALGLNRPAGWRIVACRCQPDRAVAGYRLDSLHRAFAEGLCSQNDCPAMIL